MTSWIDSKLEEILPVVEKPARYTGGELNAIVKDAGTCRIRFALAFPDVYEIGMSNLAIAILYSLLNRRNDCAAERVFAPWPDMERAMRSAGVPLYTLETRTPLRDMDIVGFSLAFELGYTNVLNMLDLAGMPVRSADRDGGAYPLVIGGGHCASNPEPLAPFVDAFVIGEGEEVLGEVLDAWEAGRGEARTEVLARLAAIPGVYVPRFYEAFYEEAASSADGLDRRRLSGVTRLRPDVPEIVMRRRVQDVDALPFPAAPIVPFIETVHDRISLEVMRGCTRGCRFCQAGMITRPVREKSPDVLLSQAAGLVGSTGHEEISLVSLSTADHSHVAELVGTLATRFADQGIGVALPSLRADVGCVHLAAEIQKVRKSGLTFAPEAGTQRMRDVINKNVTEEDLFAACEAAFRAGWRHIKLYFMIGLPTETDADVVGIADLAERVLRLGRHCGVAGLTVAVGVSSFVPKPHTPFQWHGQDTVDEIRRKQHLLKSNVRQRAIKLRWHDPQSSHLEGVLARGDRRVGEAIERAWRAGAVFDAWGDWFDFERWMDALRDSGLDPAFFANRERVHSEVLPWRHISYGVSEAYLRAEDKRARRGETTADCHTQPCTFCQACDRWLTERGSVAQGQWSARPHRVP